MGYTFYYQKQLLRAVRALKYFSQLDIIRIVKDNNFFTVIFWSLELKLKSRE